MTNALELGVLDFGSRRPSQSPKQAVDETIRFAVEAENLGYTRYWLAEHQTTNSAWASPELILPLLASKTERIKIGTAGILLQVYNPLKVASDFSLLENLFPNRIDLGIVRGLPVQSKEALADDASRLFTPDGYSNKIKLLLKYLIGSSPHPNARVIPFPARIPEVWILGSSDSSMRLASQFGTSFGYSLFHSRNPDPVTVKEYLAAFQPGGFSAQAKAGVAFAGACAETDEKAQAILRNHRNNFIIPTVVGSPATCRRQLREIQRLYEVSRFIFLDISQSFADRLVSYRLMMEASNL